MTRSWAARGVALLYVAGAIAHGAAVASAWRDVREPRGAKDFASYYYAAVVADEGGDPYDTPAVVRRARGSGRRLPVNPFFYPPPFLGLVAWAPGLSLDRAYHVWFWLQEVAILASAGAAMALSRSWGAVAPALVVLAVGLCTAVPDNLRMGQANVVVLAATLLGLWAARSPRGEWAGGALVGLACMWKMSPALFVVHALVQRRWRFVAASVLMAIASTVAALPLLDVAHQVRFYTVVLPGFGTGDYNGLAVPITMFGNHSIPNLWAQLFPGAGLLAAPARILSGGTSVGLVVGAMLAFREAADEAQRVAQVAAIAVLMLLIPVYTYEHHVVWALPAVAVVGAALWTGALPRWVIAPYVLSVACWAGSLGVFKASAAAVEAWWPLHLAVQEAKFVALVVLFAAAASLGAVRAKE